MWSPSAVLVVVHGVYFIGSLCIYIVYTVYIRYIVYRIQYLVFSI